MRIFLRFLGFLFAAGAFLFVVGAVAATWLIWDYSKDLPDYSQLQDYEPPVMTRVHAADGSLVAEYAKERRLYIPIQAVPKRVMDAFIAAEDKNFWEHGGIDVTGILRAVITNLENWGKRRPQGASTITQQVAKNFLVGSETSIHRKIKEALLAHAHRARLLQAEDSRAVPQRDLSRARRLRHRRRLAHLFRQVGARADASRRSPISPRCPRRRPICIRTGSANARPSGATG